MATDRDATDIRPKGPRRGRLFRKYVRFIVALVASVLVASGAIELYFSYRENRAALAQIQQEKALTAAVRIEQFIQALVGQLGWTTHPQWVSGESALEQRRIEFYRLLRQAPAITDLGYLDAGGREQLRVSRLALDVTDGARDLSMSEPFRSARTTGIYYGPVYFRKGSEPYMTIALPVADGGVAAAEVNLKFIWDVVSAIRIGQAGLAYVVGTSGHLIAHPDIGLVLQQTDFSPLAQVQAARAESLRGGSPDTTRVARDSRGRQVLTSYAPVAPLGWFVFLEQPLEEAWAPLYASAVRSLALMLIGLLLALLVSLVLARKMVDPIRALQAGAARIGAGELDSRIAVQTDDELGMLTELFNRMAARLQESYAGLERKVEERTRELSESLERQTATADVLRVISQPINPRSADGSGRSDRKRDAALRGHTWSHLPGRRSDSALCSRLRCLAGVHRVPGESSGARGVGLCSGKGCG